MTRLEDQTDRPARLVVTQLPESIREHRVLVDMAEWLMMRRPARLALNAEVRRRLDIEAA